MPHFIAKASSLPLPFCAGEYHFHEEFIHTQFPKQSLILVTFKDKPFLIKKAPHQKGMLFKAHKAARPSPVGILKDALGHLSKFCDVITHNLSKNSPKQSVQSPYLLSAKDFLTQQFSCYFLEIGFGSGRHILDLAQKHPNTPVIGIEIHTPSIEQVLRQIQILDLKNLYITKVDARILSNILPSNSARGIFLHFPVPWNKKPHRRVLSPSFLSQAFRILQKNGTLHLRTDDEEYFQDALKLALNAKHASFEVHKNLAQSIISKYEARWQKQNKNIYDVFFHCLQNSPPLSLAKNFPLPYHRDFFPSTQKILEEDFFVHVQACYESKNCIMLHINFGDFHAPFTSFVLVDHLVQKTSFLGQDIIPTEANLKAYERLKSIFGGSK